MRYNKSGESVIPLNRIIPGWLADDIEAVIRWDVSILSDKGDETTSPSVTVRMNHCFCIQRFNMNTLGLSFVDSMTTSEINERMCSTMVTEFLMESGELWD